LIVLFSESGCGKTFSSLLLARGFVGPKGKIAMIDTESRRGHLYADVLEGGYQVLDLEPPFSPQQYIAAMDAAVKAGYSIVIIDSGSHEWEGSGGILDMAAENEERTKRPGLHNWKSPKFEHAKFMLALMRSPIPVIVCLRAKFKTRQKKDEHGKTQIVKDDYTSPIQSEEFIFEATVHGEVMPDHSFRVTKCSHPDLRKCFPEGKPIASEHGALLAKWCEGASQTAKPASTTKKAVTPKARLWAATESIHGGDLPTLETWLREKGLLSHDQNLSDLSTTGLQEVLDGVEAELAVSE
jgi:hypothetical protein